jgi:hypothetical protein
MRILESQSLRVHRTGRSGIDGRLVDETATRAHAE